MRGRFGIEVQNRPARAGVVVGTWWWPGHQALSTNDLLLVMRNRRDGRWLLCWFCFLFLGAGAPAPEEEAPEEEGAPASGEAVVVVDLAIVDCRMQRSASVSWVSGVGLPPPCPNNNSSSRRSILCLYSSTATSHRRRLRMVPITNPQDHLRCRRARLPQGPPLRRRCVRPTAATTSARTCHHRRRRSRHAGVPSRPPSTARQSRR